MKLKKPSNYVDGLLLLFLKEKSVHSQGGFKCRPIYRPQILNWKIRVFVSLNAAF